MDRVKGQIVIYWWARGTTIKPIHPANPVILMVIENYPTTVQSI